MIDRALLLCGAVALSASTAACTEHTAERERLGPLRAMDMTVCSIKAPRFVPGVDFSNQLNDWDAGYDAVMITDTAFFRNANSHEATDTADTLDYPRMASVVEGVCATVVALARGE